MPSVWRRGLAGVVFLLAVSFSAFHWFAAYFGQPPAYVFRSTHLSMVLTIVFLRALLRRPAGAPVLGTAGLAGAALFVVGTQVFYILADVDAIYDKPGNLTTADVWIGSAYLLLTLEATRRVVGWALVVVALLFILNALLAEHLVWIFYGPSVGWTYLIEKIFFTDQGLFTTPLGAMVSYIVLFLIFGAVLFQTAAQRAFTNLALAAVGRRIGGAAKAAIVASGFLGVVSGSAVANVVTSGSVTIPLMKRLRYDRHFAGAVEATASSGGQIMPPVMGATAFIMAEFLQVPYAQVAVAALVPALIYYVSLWFMVHFEARRSGLRPVPDDQVPRLRPALAEGSTLLVTVGALTAMIATGMSVSRAGAIVIAIAIVAGLVRRGTRMTPQGFFEALEEAANVAIPVSLACAIAGVIIGAAFLSGTATRLTSELLLLGGDQLALLLVLTMLTSFVLGMGLTTSADYVLLVALTIPAIVQLGVSPMAAHMFALYFSSFSGITPPVALASFAAAGLAGGNLWRTGLLAWKVGIAAFLVPFMFVYRKGLLLEGGAMGILQDVGVCLLGVVALAAAAQGWLLGRLSTPVRLLLLAASVMLIVPGSWTDIAGLVAVLLIAAGQWRVALRSARPETDLTAPSEAAARAEVDVTAGTLLPDEEARSISLSGRYVLGWAPILIVVALVWWVAGSAWHLREFNGFFLGFMLLLGAAALLVFHTPLGQVVPEPASGPLERSTLSQGDSAV